MKSRQSPLDTLSPKEVIALMDKADARALKAVIKARKSIAQAARDAADAIRGGGRLIYVGAGTSGRLGVLDASECPPTFSVSPGQVVGVIAGGKKALYKSVEGAEDNTRAGRAAMGRLKIGARDMVVGISASGTTPYVLAALDEAERRGANTWLITCQGPALTPGPSPHLISLSTGAEVIQGSTRLAAGTATKLVLNRISTACFVLLGKVHGDLMVDVMPTNVKLVRRAVDIIMRVTGCDGQEASDLLRKSGDRPKVAIVMRMKGLTRARAESRLQSAGGSLREALHEKP